MTGTLKCLQTGLKLAVFTVFLQSHYPHLKRYLNAGKPISKPNLNRLFIGCFEKTGLSQW